MSIKVTDACIACGRCIDECPFGVITLEGDRAEIGAGCTLCGACAEVCPVEAIVIERGQQVQRDPADTKDVLIFCEQWDGIVAPVSYELLSVGRSLSDRLGSRLLAVILGSQIREQAQRLIPFGVDRVYCFDDAQLALPHEERYVELIVNLVKEIRPGIFLIGGTSLGRSLAPRIATRLGTGLTADCTGFDLDEAGNLLQTRPTFGGNLMATILCPHHRPQMATVRPKVFAPPEPVPGFAGELVEMAVPQDLPSRTEILSVTAGAVEEVNNADAEIIVAGGRGMGDPKNFALLEELAQLLGGTVAASRPVVDEGWVPYARQVGQTGRTVKPKVYIACGISGAIQHLVGMRSSDLIVAINKDPKAPIFQVAHYGIVGDVLEVVPALIAELKSQGKER